MSSNANSTLMIQIRSVTDAGNVKYKTRPATPEEIKEAMPDAMHWLPMTPDAVFEDGKKTHVCLLTNGAMFLLYPLDGGEHFATRTGFQNADEGGVKISSETTVTVPRSHITHYARITEPNK